MAEKKSDELTESADNSSKSSNNIGHYLSNNRGLGLVARPFAMEKAMAAIAQPSAIEKALESFSSQQRVINSAMAAIAQPSALEKALESFNSNQLVIDSAMASIANLPAMENTLASFAAVSSMMLRDPSSLSAIFASIEISKFSSFELENLEVNLATATDQFNNAGSLTSLTSVFANLSPLVRYIYIFILLQVFLPHINSISANLLTPVVESYLQDNNLNNREKVKEIKKIPIYLSDVTTEGLRFITGSNVRLRANPSTNSEILDELLLGQVVTVLSKDRNWIEVTYKYGDDENMIGWVFTRYTAKFVR